MASPFECEVRYRISDIQELEERLGELGARIKFPYEFTDCYFKPVGKEWDLLERTLRIREWITPADPAEILFVRTKVFSLGDVKFKRSTYPQGKVPLFSGSADTCRSLLEDMGFEHWFDVKKRNAKLWEISEHDFITAVENVESLGWTGELEFEGDDPQAAASRIEAALELLRIPMDSVSHKPISLIYAEERGIV